MSLRSLLLFSLTNAVLSLERNVTVDDRFGDELTGALPAYSPSCRQASACPECAAKANGALAYLGDWHDCYPGTINFSFTGYAVYIYGIWDTLLPVDSAIILDGQNVGTYSIAGNASPSNSDPYIYNQQLFAMQGITDQNHTVSIISEQAILFDYAVYTMEAADGVPSSSSRTSSLKASLTDTSPLATAGVPLTTDSAQSDSAHNRERNKVLVPAIVIPIIIALILVAIALYLVRKWRHKRQDAQELEKSYTPYEIVPNIPASHPRNDPDSNLSLRQESTDPLDALPRRTKFGPPLVTSNDTGQRAQASPREILPSFPRRIPARRGTESSFEPLDPTINTAPTASTRASVTQSHSDQPSIAEINAQMVRLQDQMAELSEQMRAAAYEAPPVYDRSN